ncbi:MAG: amidohydrolase [bacterium]
MKERIAQLAAQLKPKVVETYRDFHKYPEPGWTEFRTAATVVKRLQEMGYEVKYGAEVIKEEGMMGVPPAEVLAEKQQQAIEQGADPEIVAKMAGGKTGVVAILDTGKAGPTVGFRVDMDCNEVDEAKDEKHRPFREGFASINEGAMHACGHDAHTAIGLGLAELLMEIKDELKGKVKIVFQPAEEGVRGAKSMMEAGVVDDVDYMIGSHVGVSARKLGQVICGGEGFLATTKMDVTFTGVPAHAGGEPEAGRMLS